MLPDPAETFLLRACGRKGVRHLGLDKAVVFAVLLSACACAAHGQRLAGPRPADRIAHVDDAGVMRWQDDGSEVALFGVNYYPPFCIDWKVIREAGLDPRTVIRQDVSHFARMGLTAIRLHCWDRELSDAEGNLVANEHLDLLDFLVSECKAHGIYSVLTPIAWWGTPNESQGFSNRYAMHQMTTDPEARRAQMRYLTQFVQHANKLTGLAYKDDPAVVAFELINEPIFPPGTSDETVTRYIDDLAGAIRATGCRKPIFFNGWGGRLGAVGRSQIEGCSFGWYPTGLVSGRALNRDYLASVQDYPSMRDPALARQAKIVYEFDAADVPWGYMYPAMARAFRSGGAQIATQFQYDPMAIAATNENWQTHFLNLCYTPHKAVSFMIAAQAFCRLPRLQSYGAWPDSNRFGTTGEGAAAFRVSYDERLSEMATQEAFLHSNDTTTNPPAVESLRSIVGCGSSPIVRYQGAGAYFLDRLEQGAWRLEVYPDAVWVRDPYSGGRAEKVRILWREWPMRIDLPDLGEDFVVRKVAPDAGEAVQARGGRFAVTPGVYVCTARGRPAPEVRPVAFVAPPASTAPPAVYHEPPGECLAGEPWKAEAIVASAEEPVGVALHFRPAGGGAPTTLEMKPTRAYHWAADVPGSLLKAGDARYAITVTTHGKTLIFPGGMETREPPLARPQAQRASLLAVRGAEQPPAMDFGQPAGNTCSAQIVPGSDEGRFALRMSATGFGEPPSCAALRWPAKVPPENRDRLNTLVIRARGDAGTSAVEVSLVEQDGSGYGYDVPLTPAWRTVRLPLSGLRPMWSTKGDSVDLSRLSHVSIIFGSWLYGPSGRQPHALEIESIALEHEEPVWSLHVAEPTEPVVLLSGDGPLPSVQGDVPASQTRVAGMTGDRLALRTFVQGFGPAPSSISYRAHPGEGLDARRSAFAQMGALHVRARAGEAATTAVEVVLLERDGSPWGTVVPLTAQWGDVVVPLARLTHFRHWHSGPEDRGQAGDRFRPEQVEAVNVCFGAWLYPGHEHEPHAVEIDGITLELR